MQRIQPPTPNCTSSAKPNRCSSSAQHLQQHARITSDTPERYLNYHKEQHLEPPITLRHLLDDPLVVDKTIHEALVENGIEVPALAFHRRVRTLRQRLEALSESLFRVSDADASRAVVSAARRAHRRIASCVLHWSSTVAMNASMEVLPTATRLVA